MPADIEVDDIKQQLHEYIAQRFKVVPGDADFTDDVHLFDYGYVDSFGAVELAEFVQDRFAVEVKQSDLMAYPMNTITEIATFVSLRKRGEL